MGLYVNDVAVNKVKFFEALGIAQNSIPTPREKRFQFPVRTDTDGNQRHLKRLMVNEYSVYLSKENREVKVRIANTQKKDKEQNFEYFPTDNSLEAGERGEILVSDDMAYLFWYVNPMNRQSPFRKPQAPVFYEFKDNDNLAKVSNDRDEARIIAMSIVLGNNAWSISRLRTLAKGLSVPGVNDMTDEVVKSTLKERAFKDPDNFINQAESREVAFAGKIQEAIDRNLIHLKTLNGMQRWYIGQREIIPVQYGIEPRKVLDEELSSKWYMYADEVNALLENTNISTKLSAPENDKFFNQEEETIETMSEMDATVWDEYQQLVKDEIKFEKVKKYADTDLSNPGIHVATRKAAENLSSEIELYKKALAIEAKK